MIVFFRKSCGRHSKSGPKDLFILLRDATLDVVTRNVSNRSDVGEIYNPDKVGFKVPEDQLGAYRTKVKQGDAAAQNNLGIAYFNGQEVERQDLKILMVPAARNGYAGAQNNVGVLYERGLKKQNFDTSLFTGTAKAAEQGLALHRAI